MALSRLSRAGLTTRSAGSLLAPGRCVALPRRLLCKPPEPPPPSEGGSSQRVPKGFGGFFKERKGEAPGGQAKREAGGSSAGSSSSEGSTSRASMKAEPDKGGGGGGGGGAGPPGPQSQSLWAAAAVAAAALTLYNSMSDGISGSREITQADFIRDVLESGEVRHIVIVNKNRAKVYMRSPSLAEQSQPSYEVSLGNVGSFEKRLERAQADLGVAPRDYVNVTHESQVSVANELLKVGPTLLLIGFWAAFMMRGGLGGMMGGGGGGGGGGSADAPLSDRERLMRSVETAALADAPAPGRMLLANPAKFCSRNPFARPVKDLGRFGLDGPVSPDEMPPDLTAQMLPVLLLLEHGEGGSSAVLLERRTGALMGDIDIDSFGCVAIAPLWLGGTQRQNALSALHSVEGLEGAAPLRDGLWLGGWEAARPRVADSSLAAARFKFFLGATTWAAGQLEAEVAAGAWIVVEGSPELVLKERLDGSGARRAKPVWAEVLSALGEPGRTAYEAVYGSGD